MPTKAQIEQRYREATQTIKSQQDEIHRLRKCIEWAEVALRVTEGDLQRKIDWKAGDEYRTEEEREDPDRKATYQETGDEQVERFERGLEVAIARVGTVRGQLKDQTFTYEWQTLLWETNGGE